MVLHQTQIGDEVHLTLTEDAVFKKLKLTSGTELIGSILNTKESKRFRRNGYFEILITKIQTKNHEQITLNKPIDLKIYTPEIMNRKNKPKWMKTTDAIVFCADNVIPGPGLPFYIYEVFKWDKTLKEKSTRYKWGLVLVKTTTTYYWADFLIKHDSPQYAQGDIINLKLTNKATDRISKSTQNNILNN